MSLLSLLGETLQKLPNVKEVFPNVFASGKGLTHSCTVIVNGATGSLKSILISWLYSEIKKPFLVIAPAQEEARLLYQDCRAFLSLDKVRLFPDREGTLLGLAGTQDDPWVLGERVSILNQLLREESIIVIASLKASQRFTLPPDILREQIKQITSGRSYSWNDFILMLVTMGYVRSPLVEVPGTFSVRGGIIDLFPAGSLLPVRLDWLGNELESMKYFDPVSQRTVDKLENMTIIPVREYCWDKDRVEASRQGVAAISMGKELKEHLQGQWELFKAGSIPPEFEYFYSLYYPGKATLWDYFPSHFVIAEEFPERWDYEWHSIENEVKDVTDVYVERKELPENIPFPYCPINTFNKVRYNKQRIVFPETPLYSSVEERASRQYEINLETEPSPIFVRRFPEFLTALSTANQDKKQVMVFSTQASRLSHMLKDKGIESLLLPHEKYNSLGQSVFDTIKGYDGISPMVLIPVPLSGGFSIPALPLTVWSDKELLGKVVIPVSRGEKPRFRGKPITLEDLSQGDLVVHVMYGIARFDGLTSLQTDSQKDEFLQLVFANDDKLYVPVYDMEKVQKYIGSEGYTPPLSRLGGKEWGNKKKKIVKAVEEVAGELIRMEAVRKEHPGHSCAPDTPWQLELEDAFPFDETPDQARAIEDVKSDMENTKPMDRLVLGDAGYGKTEVALRASFKTLMDGRQVAVLVPTTILAQQHFLTFSERLSPFPICLELLSRFKTPMEQKKIIEGLGKGEVDIVIGTHRLLQKDVTFSNLGLVVIDEEQRFGVKNKERLKHFKESVDVLTLSATPIPRTLHMSLVGARDMSLIETPPHDRLPVKTYVATADPPIIKQAIQIELERGGQVYFLHNRVENIARIAQMVAQLVPKARIGVAHGQMYPKELESIMSLFIEGFYDILVCTTIIENGLDITNVNTLIVDDAHLLGLAQLYQLRGRIGRSHTQAYAYFLTPPRKKLTEEAWKRLETIRDFTNFGAGHQIAMRDLEIRGAGNLLGVEQHGHIGAVGFHLYCQLLALAIKVLKGEKGKEKESEPVQIRLPVQAFIPDTYVDDKLLKMSAYRKLTRAGCNAELEAVREELLDRFGPIPKESENLLLLVKLKLLAESRQVTVISGAPNAGDPSLGIRVTIEWKGKIHFTTPLPPILEITAGEEYVAFTPCKEEDLLSTVISVINSTGSVN